MELLTLKILAMKVIEAHVRIVEVCVVLIHLRQEVAYKTELQGSELQSCFVNALFVSRCISSVKMITPHCFRATVKSG
jgi:hypothetical protein